jgi:peptidyl-prolyl cis-trans isomerase C
MWWRDPLIHFLLIGAVLFAVLTWRGGEDASPGERIVIPEERILQLRQAASVLQGREPTQAELAQLVEPAIREEVYYREALALGLDDNDDEVRRRLIEKVQYLTEDLADPEPATEQDLIEFFASAPERFRIPELVTFDQVFFSPSVRGETLADDVAAGLEALRSGAAPADVGDGTPLQERFVDAPRERVEVLFGTKMTEAIFELAPGQWFGPYGSDFGQHLVRVVAHTAAREPPFDEVRDKAAELFAEDRRIAANERAYAQMRSHYDIVVEWPADDQDTGGP